MKHFDYRILIILLLGVISYSFSYFYIFQEVFKAGNFYFSIFNMLFFGILYIDNCIRE